jgi:translation initiation factor IF-1
MLLGETVTVYCENHTEHTKHFQIIYRNSVRTSQETHHVSATKPNRVMLFGETVTVYCENHTKHTNTLCGENAEFLCVKAGGTYTLGIKALNVTAHIQWQ